MSLRQSHAVQDKELSRLRAETLSLAAKTAAAAATPRRPSTSSSTGGGGGRTAGQQQDGLQQQLAAAEEHNQMLLLQVGKLQEANSLLQRQLGKNNQGLREVRVDVCLDRLNQGSTTHHIDRQAQLT